MRSIGLFFTALIVLAACTSEPERRPSEDGQEKVVSDFVSPVEGIRQMSTEDQLAKLDEIRNNMEFDFALGKGDILAISVYGEPDLTVSEIPVRLDGQISFPLIGDVQAEGLRVNEVRDIISSRLEDYLLNPKVSVIPVSFRSLSYTVSGEVIKPGTFPLVTDVTLTQAIAQAGGLQVGNFRGTTVEVADLPHAFLARNNEFLPIDFVQLIRHGDMRFDVPMMPGDYVFIPSGLAREVYILGEVTSPGLFAYTEGFTVSAALAQANGFTVDANLTSVHVVRGSLGNPELFVINLEDVLKGKSRDIVLKPSDVIYVPPTGLTMWSRIVAKIIPSLSAIQASLILSGQQ